MHWQLALIGICFEPVFIMIECKETRLYRAQVWGYKGGVSEERYKKKN